MLCVEPKSLQGDVRNLLAFIFQKQKHRIALGSLYKSVSYQYSTAIFFPLLLLKMTVSEITGSLMK